MRRTQRKTERTALRRTPRSPRLVLEGVDAARDGERLRDVNLAVHAGETVIVYGSGSALLVDVALGRASRSRGIILCNEDILPGSGLDGRQPQNTAVVDANIRIPAAATGTEALAVSLFLSGLDRSTAKARARHAVEDAGLGALASRPLDTLVLDDLHLLDLVRAVAVRPDLLVVRDPWPRQNPSVKPAFLSLLGRAVAEGFAVLLATVDVHLDRIIADIGETPARVLLLRNGRVADNTAAHHRSA